MTNASLIDSAIRAGAEIADRSSLILEGEIQIGRGARILPNVRIIGRCIIEQNAEIGIGCEIIDSTIGKSATLKNSCIIERSTVSDSCTIGPFVIVRGSELELNCSISSHSLVSQSTIARYVKIGALCFVADANIDEMASIQAGVITSNYDGKMKHRILVGSGAFVGAGVHLIAPVKIGRDSYIGSGSVITDDVPDGALAIGRGRQINKMGWTTRGRTKAPDPVKIRRNVVRADTQELISEFRRLLDHSYKEERYHQFLRTAKFVFGSEYDNILSKQRLGSKHVVDFLCERADGSFDIFEIKRPSDSVYRIENGRVIESQQTKSAIAQIFSYMDYVKTNYLSELYTLQRDLRINRGIVVIGRSRDRIEKSHIFSLNRRYLDIKIVTYDDLARTGEKMLNLMERMRTGFDL